MSGLLALKYFVSFSFALGGFASRCTSESTDSECASTEETAAPALLQSRSVSVPNSTRQSLALEVVLEDMEHLMNATLFNDKVVAAGLEEGYDGESLIGLGRPTTVVLDPEGKELARASLTNGSGIAFPARVRFTFPEPGAALAEGGELRARDSADYDALDDTLEALQAEDPTAGCLVEQYHPVFDMDGDSCLPSAAVSRTGRKNPGAPLSENGLTSDCRSRNFMRTSNTYHRWDRTMAGDGDVWEVHLFELYFEKDDLGGVWSYNFRRWRWEWVPLPGGHVHDVETVAMLFLNNEPQYVGVSAHGSYALEQFKEWSSVPKLGGHPKVVYHRHGHLTRSFRFAKRNEADAENPTRDWVMPPLASWFEMEGDGKSNADMRGYLNGNRYGKASFKIKDSSCRQEADKVRDRARHFGTNTPSFDFGPLQQPLLWQQTVAA